MCSNCPASASWGLSCLFLNELYTNKGRPPCKNNKKMCVARSVILIWRMQSCIYIKMSLAILMLSTSWSQCGPSHYFPLLQWSDSQQSNTWYESLVISTNKQQFKFYQHRTMTYMVLRKNIGDTISPQHKFYYFTSRHETWNNNGRTSDYPLRKCGLWDLDWVSMPFCMLYWASIKVLWRVL